ncbi:unnamed protein product [Eretmochelys imbricata]
MGRGGQNGPNVTRELPGCSWLGSCGGGVREGSSSSGTRRPPPREQSWGEEGAASLSCPALALSGSVTVVLGSAARRGGVRGISRAWSHGSGFRAERTDSHPAAMASTATTGDI